MKFKGTIVITDPCYLFPDNNDILWEKTNFGEDMKEYGFTQYLYEDTIYGDWKCGVYKYDKPYEVIDKIADLEILHANSIEKFIKSFYSYWTSVSKNMSYLGSFTADAGLVGVYLLDEVLKFNPDFEKWVKEHDQCATIIRNFDGNITYYVDDNDGAHIIGEGNVNFFSSQTAG